MRAGRVWVLCVWERGVAGEKVAESPVLSLLKNSTR